MTDETKGSCVLFTCIVVLLSICVFGIIRLNESALQERKEKRESGHYLPEGATNIIDVGDSWQEFTYKGQRFLFYDYGAIVKIDMPKVEND